MPFREKSAWVMAAIVLISAVLYATLIGSLPRSVPPLSIIIAYVVVLALVSVFGQVAIALFAPRDAGAAADERDRRIADRAGHLSGNVLAVGVVLALGMYVLGHPGSHMFHAVLFSLMAAQLAEYGLQIWYYRRGV